MNVETSAQKEFHFDFSFHNQVLILEMDFSFK